MTILLIALCASVAVASAAESPRTRFDAGVKQYRDGAYEKAIHSFNQLVDEGYESGPLYSNLASAYYKNGDIGRAVLFFERAVRLDPGNENYRHNLMVARARTRDRIEPVPLLFFVRWWNDIKDGHTAATLLVWTVITAWLVAGTVFVFFGYRGVILRRIALASMTVIGAVFIASVVMYAAKLEALESRREAVVMPAEVIVRSTPDASGVESFTIHEGLTVTILAQDNGYRKIRLRDGKTGWVGEDAIERI